MSIFKFSSITLSWLLLIQSNAYAINKVGNGGDVVSCKSSTQLLDFYEDQKNETLKSSDDYKMILKNVFQRLEKTAPKVFTPYIKRIDSIQNDIEFKKDIRLTNIQDSNEFFIPKKCELIQIAIRKKSVGANEKRFLIDEELWGKLDSVHKAGLISHEIIYEHLSQLGQTDSVNVRKINRFIFSKNSKETDFWKLIQESKIPLYP